MSHEAFTFPCLLLAVLFGNCFSLPLNFTDSPGIERNYANKNVTLLWKVYPNMSNTDAQNFYFFNHSSGSWIHIAEYIPAPNFVILHPPFNPRLKFAGDGTTSSGITISDFSQNDTGQYKMVYSLDGSENDNAYTFFPDVKIPEPVLSQYPPGVSVDAQESVEFNCTVNKANFHPADPANIDYTYIWLIDDLPITTTTYSRYKVKDYKLTIHNVTATDVVKIISCKAGLPSFQNDTASSGGEKIKLTQGTPEITCELWVCWIALAFSCVCIILHLTIISICVYICKENSNSKTNKEFPLDQKPEKKKIKKEPTLIFILWIILVIWIILFIVIVTAFVACFSLCPGRVSTEGLAPLILGILCFILYPIVGCVLLYVHKKYKVRVLPCLRVGENTSGEGSPKSNGTDRRPSTARISKIGVETNSPKRQSAVSKPANESPKHKDITMIPTTTLPGLPIKKVDSNRRLPPLSNSVEPDSEEVNEKKKKKKKKKKRENDQNLNGDDAD